MANRLPLWFRTAESDVAKGYSPTVYESVRAKFNKFLSDTFALQLSNDQQLPMEYDTWHWLLTLREVSFRNLQEIWEYYEDYQQRNKDNPDKQFKSAEPYLRHIYNEWDTLFRTDDVLKEHYPSKTLPPPREYKSAVPQQATTPSSPTGFTGTTTAANRPYYQRISHTIVNCSIYTRPATTILSISTRIILLHHTRCYNALFNLINIIVDNIMVSVIKALLQSTTILFIYKFVI
jgi:hypothetical protein